MQSALSASNTCPPALLTCVYTSPAQPHRGLLQTPHLHGYLCHSRGEGPMLPCDAHQQCSPPPPTCAPAIAIHLQGPRSDEVQTLASYTESRTRGAAGPCEVPWQEEPNTPASALICEYALCCHSALQLVCALPCSPHVRSTTVRTLRHQMRCLLRSHATRMNLRTLQPHLQRHLIQRTFRQDSRSPGVLFAAWAGPGA